MSHVFTNKAKEPKALNEDLAMASMDKNDKKPAYVSLLGKSPQKFQNRLATAQTVSSRQKMVETLGGSRSNLNSASKKQRDPNASFDKKSIFSKEL